MYLIVIDWIEWMLTLLVLRDALDVSVYAYLIESVFSSFLDKEISKLNDQ